MAAPSITPVWDSSTNSLTATNLQSIISGGGWQSAIIDNTSNQYADFQIVVTVATISGTLGTSPTINVYLAPELESGVFGDGVVGGNAAYTPLASQNIALVASPAVNTAATSMTFGIIYCNTLNITPTKFVVVVVNSSGLALASSGNTVSWRGVRKEIVMK